VAATVHGSEGLNEMVYNRCVGTRYCANNCPYKVRRFNFLDYTDYRETPVLGMLQNPDVTVRSRGVMEKCSFCVQRIQEARMEARREGVALTDGAVRPACEQSCPAKAIVFGDVNDAESRVSQAVASSRAYRVLEELNVRPSVSYLAVVRDAISGGEADHG
jgi:molybdopterin-containing oxidoreductase family iron-sulfur binding subunit